MPNIDRTRSEAKEAEFEWLDRVDRIDPFFGSKEELTALLESAPTQEHRTWLSEQIKKNEAFQTQLLGGGE